MKILKISMLALTLGLMSFTVISKEETTTVNTT